MPGGEKKQNTPPAKHMIETYTGNYTVINF